MEVTPQQPMDPAVHRDLVEPYLLGELSGEDRAHFERHLFDCEPCAEKVKAGSRLIETVRGSVSQRTIEVAGAVLVPPAAKPSASSDFGFAVRLRAWLTPVAAMASAALLPLALYQQLVVIPEWRREVALRDTPRAVTPITLRSAARGAGKPISIDAQTRILALAVEAPADDGRRLLASIADERGQVHVAPFVVERPALGDPLILQLPVHRLAPATYELRIAAETREHISGPTFEHGRYPFVIERK